MNNVYHNVIVKSIHLFLAVVTFCASWTDGAFEAFPEKRLIFILLKVFLRVKGKVMWNRDQL